MEQTHRSPVVCAPNLLRIRSTARQRLFLQCSRDPPFRIEFDRAKREGQLSGWTNADGADGLVTAAIEQLALVTDDSFHEFPFVLIVN